MAELTEEEGKKLIEAFNKLKLKPKADTPQDLELWLKAFSGVKAEPGVPTDGATGGTSGSTSKESIITSQQPRIPCSFGDKVICSVGVRGKMSIKRKKHINLRLLPKPLDVLLEEKKVVL